MKLSTVIPIQGIILSIYNMVLMHATHVLHLCASHADSVVLYQHTSSGTVFIVLLCGSEHPGSMYTLRVQTYEFFLYLPRSLSCGLPVTPMLPTLSSWACSGFMLGTRGLWLPCQHLMPLLYSSLSPHLPATALCLPHAAVTLTYSTSVP